MLLLEIFIALTFAISGVIALPAKGPAKDPADVVDPSARVLSPLHGEEWRKRPDAFKWRNDVPMYGWQRNCEEDWKTVTTPYLPAGVVIPEPLLPTQDSTTQALYNLAIAQNEVHQRLNGTQFQNSMDKKLKDAKRFSVLVICMYGSLHRCPSVGVSASLFWGATKYVNEAKAVRERLIEDMRIEGLINLGRKLQAFMASSGEHM